MWSEGITLRWFNFYLIGFYLVSIFKSESLSTLRKSTLWWTSLPRAGSSLMRASSWRSPTGRSTTCGEATGWSQFAGITRSANKTLPHWDIYNFVI